MVLVATCLPNGRRIYNGTFPNRDGSTTFQREFLIPWARDKYSNPVGRILGNGAGPKKQIMRDTGTTIIVHTNDITFLRTEAKVTVTFKGNHQAEAWARVNQAIRRVLELCDNDHVGNRKMSEFQLFSPTITSELIDWRPTAFARKIIMPNIATWDEVGEIPQHLLTVNDLRPPAPVPRNPELYGVEDFAPIQPVVIVPPFQFQQFPPHLAFRAAMPPFRPPMPFQGYHTGAVRIQGQRFFSPRF